MESDGDGDVVLLQYATGVQYYVGGEVTSRDHLRR